MSEIVAEVETQFAIALAGSAALRAAFEDLKGFERERAKLIWQLGFVDGKSSGLFLSHQIINGEQK